MNLMKSATMSKLALARSTSYDPKIKPFERQGDSGRYDDGRKPVAMISTCQLDVCRDCTAKTDHLHQVEFIQGQGHLEPLDRSEAVRGREVAAKTTSLP